MSTLYAASVRHLLRHPAQLALALLGLALGVATLIAVDIATASSGRAFELSMEAVNGAATHEIRGGPAGIDETVYVRLRQRRLNVALSPVVEGYVDARDETMQLIGIDPLVDGNVRGASSGISNVTDAVVTSGGGSSDGGIGAITRWMLEPGTVVLAEAAANRFGLRPEDELDIRIGGSTHSARLIGLLRTEGAGYDSLVLTDISQAQEWLGLQGRLSRIDVRAPEGAAGEAALKALEASLPPGVTLEPGQRRAQQNLDMTAAFTTNLQAMSLLALLVGVFLIFSAVSFAVVQRRRTIGVLRALGVTRTQVLRLILGEALVLGVVGSALGLLLGMVIGRELVALVSRTINDLYFVVAVNEVVVPPASIVRALCAGIGVALVAAAVPAIEVAHSPPALGLRRSAVEHRARSAARWLVAASGVMAIASAVIVSTSSRSLLAGFIALFLLLLTVAALTPAVLRALALITAKLAGRFSAIGRLAASDVAASLSRTGVAVAALGLAVAAMIGVSIMVESFRESLRTYLAQTLRADLYITAPGPGFGRPERRIEPEVLEDVLRQPFVASHTESRRAIVDSPRGPVRVDALRLTPAARQGIPLTSGDFEQVWRAFDEGALIVSEPLAWHLQLAVGDRLPLHTATGLQELEVAGIYREYGNDRGSVMMSRDVYRRLWQDDEVTAIGLYLKAGEEATQARAALREVVAGRQSLAMTANAEVRAISMRIFERTFVITRVLYWLTAGVAAIGLVSALLAWELERSRELALLRALGLSPRGAGAMIETQTGFMGLVAFLAAIPAGVATAVLLITVINRRAFGWQIDFHFTAEQFANAFAVAMVAALAAGLYPAWRMARAPLASEIREE